MNAFFSLCLPTKLKWNVTISAILHGEKPYANRNFIAYDVPLAARCLADIKFTLQDKKNHLHIFCAYKFKWNVTNSAILQEKKTPKNILASNHHQLSN